MFMQRLENADRSIVVTRKYSVERDPLAIVEKIVQDLIRDLTFEFTVKDQVFIKGNIISCQRRFIACFAPFRVFLRDRATQEYNTTLPMYLDQVFYQFL